MRRTKMIALLALALVMALAIVSTASATEDRSANIKFKEGGIIIDTDGTDMDLQFGEHYIPAERVVYYTNGVNSLGESSSGTAGPTEYNVSIKDNRSTPQAWTYSVSLGDFEATGSAPSFQGTVYLLEGATSSNAYVGIPPGMTLTVNNGSAPAPVNSPSGTMIAPTNTDVTVITATTALGSGIHQVTWQDANVGLDIGDSYRNNGIGVDTYKALMTWTLTP